MMKKRIIYGTLLTVLLMLAGCAQPSVEFQAEGSAEKRSEVSVDEAVDGSVEVSVDETVGGSAEETIDDNIEDVTVNNNTDIEDETNGPTDKEMNANFLQLREPGDGDTVVTMTTNFGDIKMLLFKEAAPKTVENFVTHAEEGYYDGVIFHRVINDFMIQGGDPEGTGRGGESIWGGSFEDEFNGYYFPYRGALCMANAGPNTNGSQFFVVQTDLADETVLEQMKTGGWPTSMVDAYETLGGTVHLYFKHTVFGQVIEGMDVVDAIAVTETDGSDKPINDVVINSISVELLTE